MKKNTFGDFVLAEFVMIIGVAEVAHLAGVFLGWTFSRCAMLFGIMAVLVVLAGGVWAFLGRDKWFEQSVRVRKKAGLERKDVPADRHAEISVRLLYGAFCLVAASQILFILFANPVYRQGDMTAETVGSFLENDGVYLVNPMTGQAFTAGIPLRIKILCLPTLYGSICRLTGLAPVFAVQTLVPIFVLLISYVAFGVLGRSLFGEDVRKRGLFLLMVSLLIWGGAYMYGMDGFGLLCSGFRGVTVRNCVLIPWTFSLCIRKKWMGAILCILGEACIVWTLYGMGMCLLVAAGMLAAQVICAKFLENKADADGKEDA